MATVALCKTSDADRAIGTVTASATAAVICTVPSSSAALTVWQGRLHVLVVAEAKRLVCPMGAKGAARRPAAPLARLGACQPDLYARQALGQTLDAGHPTLSSAGPLSQTYLTL